MNTSASLEALTLILTLGLAACGGSSSDSGSAPNLETPAFFFGTMTNLRIDIAYEPNAEPYSNYDWTFIQRNLAALFEGRAIVPAISFPSSSLEAVVLERQNKPNWTLFEILDLANKVRPGVTEGTTGRFIILFLNGYLNDNGTSKNSVIGLSIRGTTVMAMFKDVVRSTAARDGGRITRFVEGTTIVHELGHALGLVNNGITLASQHHDAANGAHCSNPECVMYYANEGAKDAIEFFRKYQATNDPVVFDTKCLQDARTFKP